jgi:AcrR family transcriptional regulator
MSPKQVALHQRRRLEGAMVEAVARHGYSGTTLRELVALAGVSKSTFYEHFESKEECFWTTFQGIVDVATETVVAAYGEAEGQRDRLRAALGAYAKLLVDEPVASSLVAVESLCLGATGAKRRDRAAEPFEEALRNCYAEEPRRGEISEPIVRAAIGGYRHVVYRCLRARRPEALAESCAELADWMLDYQQPRSGPRFDRGPFVEPGSRAAATEDQEGKPAWEEPPDSPESRWALTQRERIVRAVARLAAAEGYASLTVPAISGTAGVSNQTFYQEFRGKQVAFLAAFDELAAGALEQVERGFAEQDVWPQAAAAGTSALLSFVTENPYFARVAFFELSAAGPPGLDRADALMDRFIELLKESARANGVEPPPPIILEAIGGGIWAVIEHELNEDRAAQLPQLAGKLLDFILVPFQPSGRGRARDR